MQTTFAQIPNGLGRGVFGRGAGGGNNSSNRNGTNSNASKAGASDTSSKISSSSDNSINLVRPRVRDVFPLPVLPKTPIF